MINFRNYIEAIPDYPKDGIIYRDIQPLLMNQTVFKEAIKRMGNMTDIPDYWVALESRGFLFASALSYKFGGGIRLIRKPGKLPNEGILSVPYELEYGKGHLEMAIFDEEDATCVIVDDVLATGGTMEAAQTLCEANGLEIIDKIVLVDIGISDVDDVKSLVYYGN